MSFLGGVKPRNHPQQVAAKGSVCDVTDDRGTPASLFDPLHREFHFTLDAAASAREHRVPRYFTRAQDGLAQSWRGERVWCNPPFSQLAAWTAKAFGEVHDGHCPLAVLLLPANRTEQLFWQTYIEPVRDRGFGVSTRFVPGRPRFTRPPEAAPVKNGDRPLFGVVLVIIQPVPPGALL
jgi:phage N-6-adenine-methyltransferase